ncbi:hypothetical protein SVAN01_00883 [Stagonosporopsis vannaccii]|nr:hypothetical protein SVAN01_00883 [Stagonosporopsis vannaccii]
MSLYNGNLASERIMMFQAKAPPTSVLRIAARTFQWAGDFRIAETWRSRQATEPPYTSTTSSAALIPVASYREMSEIKQSRLKCAPGSPLNTDRLIACAQTGDCPLWRSGWVVIQPDPLRVAGGYGSANGMITMSISLLQLQAANEEKMSCCRSRLECVCSQRGPARSREAFVPAGPFSKTAALRTQPKPKHQGAHRPQHRYAGATELSRPQRSPAQRSNFPTSSATHDLYTIALTSHDSQTRLAALHGASRPALDQKLQRHLR